MGKLLDSLQFTCMFTKLLRYSSQQRQSSANCCFVRRKVNYTIGPHCETNSRPISMDWTTYITIKLPLCSGLLTIEPLYAVVS